MNEMRIVPQMQCHPKSSCPLIILLFKIIDHHTSGQSSNWEEDDDCDELVRLQRAWHGSTWRPARPLPFLFLPSLPLPSFLPLGSTQSISASSAMSECSPKTLTTKNRLTGFPGLPPGVASSTRPMGNHLTNERVSGGGEEPPKCPESLNNRRQIE